jgi:uncharacterized protein (TIGR03032 family)
MTDKEIENSAVQAQSEAIDAPQPANTEAIEQLKKLIKENKQALKKEVKLDVSPDLFTWLKEQQVSLAFTTASTSKLFSIGVSEDDKVTIGERDFFRPTTLYAQSPNTAFLAAQNQIWRLENNIPADKDFQGFNAVYVPQQSFMTGDLQIKDLVADNAGRIVFVSSLFSCLGTVSPQHSFIPVWKPKFVTQLVAEQRCNLTGVAFKNNVPEYVTSTSQSDTKLGWQSTRADGGCLIHVASGEVMVDGLSMPTCPRFHNDQLWLLNSGTGYLGYVELATGKFIDVAFCPGYMQGLTFVGDYAIVTVSKSTKTNNIDDLPLTDNLKQHDKEAQSGIYIIDTKTGDTAAYLTFQSVIDEVFSVAAFKGIQRGLFLSPQMPEVGRMISIGSPVKQNAPSSSAKH